MKDVTESTHVKFWDKRQKRCNFYYSFYLSSGELISTDQSVQTYFTVFGFCQTLILMQLFKENISGKITFYIAKCDTSQELFSQFCHFWRYFSDKMLSVQRVCWFIDNTEV